MTDTASRVADSSLPQANCANAQPAPREPSVRLLLSLVPKELRYLAVGATCALLYNILLIGTVTLGVGTLPATLIALAPMLFVGYALHAAVTFDARFSLAAFLRYCLTILASYPVWIAVLFLLADVAALPIIVAAPLGTVIMFALNYVTAHWAILRSVRAAFRLGPPAA